MSDLKYGNCGTCRFAEKIGKDHYKRKYHDFFCRRFPPLPPSSEQDIWNQRPAVRSTDGCYEYEDTIR